MLEFIFVDLPLALVGYVVVVLLIMRFKGDPVHDTDEVPLGFDSTPSQGIDAHTMVRIDDRDASEPQTEAAFERLEEDAKSEYENLPTDSQLRRHFITNLLTIATDIHPQPQDSTLKRHNEQLVLSLVQQMLEDPSKRDEFQDLAIEIRSSFVRDCQLPDIRVEEANPTTDLIEEEQTEAGFSIPEDSVLRRHFIQGFVSQIEASYPRPTDDTLLRHYNQWIECLLEEVLQKS